MVLATAGPAAAQMKTGAYTGDGVGGRSIAGLGFQPDIVLIKVDYCDPGVNPACPPEVSSAAVLRTSTMSGDSTKPLVSQEALAANLIQSLDVDGFTVGNDTRVNGLNVCGSDNLSPCDYYWTAWKVDADVTVGTYTGNGISNGDPQSITGLDFSPDYVITMGEGSRRALNRVSTQSLGTNLSQRFTPGGPVPDGITSLDANGFTVVKSTSTNDDQNTNGQIYHYIAWNADSNNKMTVGEYTGDGVDNRAITGLGFQPEYVIAQDYNESGDAYQRSDKMTGDASSSFRRALGPNFIQALLPDGFEVGTHPNINDSPGGCGGAFSPPDCHYFYAAFNEYGTTNYRSIGTASAGSDGSVTATNGSANVTGSGTFWDLDNRGRGDVITIDGADYTVFDVVSDTELRLTTPFAGTTGSGKAYTIRRQYSTIEAWEDCIDGGPCAFFPVGSSSLVADNRSEVGILYKDSIFTPASFIEIRGATTDATHNITLTVMPDNRHNGIPGNGVVYQGTGGGDTGLHVRDSYTTVEWIEFQGVKGALNAAAVTVASPNVGEGQNVVLSHLLVHDFLDTTLGNDGMGIRLSGSSGGKSVTIRNCMIWDGDLIGIQGDEPGETVVVENCSIDNMDPTSGRGIDTSSSTFTVKNTISTSNPNDDFNGNFDAASTNNISSDATAPGSNALTIVDAVDLYVTPNVDLHLKTGANVAVDSGVDLSTGFFLDIDGGSRTGVSWDRGADEREATTAVELVSFEATGLNGEVVVKWQTASELSNLGFLLHRARSAEGPYERITNELVPGLGSSPVGASYRYRDTGVENGVLYYYELEDIETTGRTERHGPVSARPSSTAPPREENEPEARAGTSLLTYGAPSESSFRVIERGRRHLVLELRTGGFYAEPQEDGTVRLLVPGFDSTDEPDSPSLPLKRPWVDVLSGTAVEVVSVEERSVESIQGLVPAGATTVEMTASPNGTLRAVRRVRRADGARGSSRRDELPSPAARLVAVGYQGDARKAQVELAPFRWDPSTRRLSFARQLRVHLALRGPSDELVEVTGRARRHRSRGARGRTQLLARLVTRERGLYEVGYEELFGRRSTAVPASSLRLSRQGKPVAFHVEPAGPSFTRGSRLYFFGEGADSNPFGNEAVYELESGEEGLRMDRVAATPTGAEASFYRARTTKEENRLYQAGLIDVPDPWFWEPIFAPRSEAYSFETDSLSAASGVPAELSVWLQGASDFDESPDHHVRVYVNGHFVSETSWDGKTSRVLEVELSPGLLQEGANELVVENVDDTKAAYSMVMLDRFSLTYPRQLVAREGRLEGAFGETGQATVREVGSFAYVLDIAETPRWIEGVRTNGGGSVSFRVDANRRYLVTSAEATLRPDVRSVPLSRLRASSKGSDYLIIGPEDFLSEAKPLLELRAAQGLHTRAVAIEDIFSAFGFGEPRPEAIRDFLEYAYRHWRSPSLRYVVLLGDGTYDFKDYLKTGVVNRVPPLIVRTSYLWTASDPTLAAVHGDDILPDLAIGRLPAANRAELRMMVEKILAFESGGAGFDGPVTLVTDRPDSAGGFVADAETIGREVLAGHELEFLHLSELGRDQLGSNILETFDRGVSLISYLGHGGIHLWSKEDVFNVGDVESLRPQPQQPLFVTMNCLNGYFHFPYFDSLAEAVLKAEGKGAIAAFSPTGLSLNTPANRYHRLLLDEVFNGNHERLGDAVLAAQSAYALSGVFPELLTIYHLFGDPALQLR